MIYSFKSHRQAHNAWVQAHAYGKRAKIVELWGAWILVIEPSARIEEAVAA